MESNKLVQHMGQDELTTAWSSTVGYMMAATDPAALNTAVPRGGAGLSSAPLGNTGSATLAASNSTNSTSNSGDLPYQLMIWFDHGSLKYIILVSYMATFLLGLLGNSLVIYIIAKFTKVRIKSVANYYIWNLAFADVLFVMVLPLFCYATFTRHWPFGPVACKVAYAFREINKFAAVFTLVALSADRYLATCHELSYLRTIQVGKAVCIAIWLVCALIATPYIMFANTSLTVHETISCRILWPEQHVQIYMAFWTFFQLLVGLLAPLALICLSYLLLVRRLGVRMGSWQQSQSGGGAQSTSSASSSRENNRKPGRKLTQTVVIVVVTFIMCQMPYHAVQIVSLYKASQALSASANGQSFKPAKWELSTFVYFNALAQILVFVSSCCNPVIYALFNENFRKLYSFVLCKCKRGTVKLEELKELEVDGKHVPISLKIQITFHVPCGGGGRNNNKSPTQQTVELENGIEMPALGQGPAAV